MYSVHFIKLQLLIFLLPHSYFIFPWNVLLEMLICSFSINKRKSKKKQVFQFIWNHSLWFGV